MDLQRIKKLAGLLTEAAPVIYDYGRRDPVRTTPLRMNPWHWMASERAKTKQDLVNNTGDNPMKDPIDYDDDDDDVAEALEEDCGCGGDPPPSDPNVEALHLMLNNAGVEDEMIMNNAVQLTPEGKAKVSAKLNVPDVDQLLTQLASKLSGEQEQLADDYLQTVRHRPDDEEEDDRFLRDRAYEEEINEGPFDQPTGGDGGAPVGTQPQQEQFAYESDYMGNVTVRDTRSGKEVFLQGAEGAQLLDQLQAAEPDQRKVQELLSQFEPHLHPPVRFDQLTTDSMMKESELDEMSASAAGVMDKMNRLKHAGYRFDVNPQGYRVWFGDHFIGGNRMQNDNLEQIARTALIAAVQHYKSMNVGQHAAVESVDEDDGGLDGNEPDLVFTVPLELHDPNTDEWGDVDCEVHADYDRGYQSMNRMYPSDPSGATVVRVVRADTGQDITAVLPEHTMQWLADLAARKAEA